jgi:hypothetical protein
MTVPTLRFPALFAAALLPLSAQEKAPARLELRPLAFDASLSLPEAYAHDPAAPASTAAIKTPIKTYLNHEFATVFLTGRKIIFTTKPERASLERPAERIGETTLPDDFRSGILLFLPGNAGDKTDCRILPIDDSKRAFPAGSFRVSNLSPQPVRIVLEEKNHDFKPGDTGFIHDPPVREGNQSGMKAFAFADNVWQRIASGVWPHPGTNRVLQILYLDAAAGCVQLRAFDDIPPREAKPQP